jgi:hypothetical protein
MLPPCGCSQSGRHPQSCFWATVVHRPVASAIPIDWTAHRHTSVGVPVSSQSSHFTLQLPDLIFAGQATVGATSASARAPAEQTRDHVMKRPPVSTTEIAIPCTVFN